MRINDIKALHGKTIEELLKQQSELEMELARTRFQKQSGKLKNVSLPKMLADDLARVKTVLSEKKLTTKVSKPEVKKVDEKPVKKIAKKVVKKTEKKTEVKKETK